MARKKKASKKASKKATTKRQQQNAAADDAIVMAFRLRFTAPLIMHNFDQKSVEEILMKQAGMPVEQKPKIPRECIERATTRNANGVPAILPSAFKKATLSGATGLQMAKGLKLRSRLWIMGQSIPISYESKQDRMDTVKVGPWNSRTTDIRFRPQFNGVTCNIAVKCPAGITQEMLITILERGGDSGVGEWRPQKGGNFGTYEIDDVITTVEGVKEVIEASSVPIPPLVIPDWAKEIEVSPTVMARIMDENKDVNDAAE